MSRPGRVSELQAAIFGVADQAPVKEEDSAAAEAFDGRVLDGDIGGLETIIWRSDWRVEGRGAQPRGFDVLRGRRGLRDAKSRTPFLHWPTSLGDPNGGRLYDLRVRHLYLLKRLLSLLRASGDVAGLAAVLRILCPTVGRPEPWIFEPTIWLLEQGASFDEPSGQTTKGPAKLLVYLKRFMQHRTTYSDKLDTRGRRRKVQQKDGHRCLALQRMLEVMVARATKLDMAVEILRGEMYRAPFHQSPRLQRTRCLIEILARLQAHATDPDDHTTIPRPDRLFTALSKDPLGSLQQLHHGTAASSSSSSSSGSLRDVREMARRVESLIVHHRVLVAAQATESEEEIEEQVGGKAAIKVEDGEADEPPRGNRNISEEASEGMRRKWSLKPPVAAPVYVPDGLAALHVGLIILTAATGPHSKRALAAAASRLQEHALDGRHRKSASSQAMCWRLFTSARPQGLGLRKDHPWALACLKAWVELDATADHALEELVLAYRRQMLRSYRDPSAPVHICRRRVVQALVRRLASMNNSHQRSPPQLAGRSALQLLLNRRVRLARWLANALGPLRQKLRDSWRSPLAAVDWTNQAAVQRLIGRMQRRREGGEGGGGGDAAVVQALNPCLRGCEWAALELFDPLSHFPPPPLSRLPPRHRAFIHQWGQIFCPTLGGGVVPSGQVGPPAPPPPHEPLSAWPSCWERRERTWHAIKYCGQSAALAAGLEEVAAADDKEDGAAGGAEEGSVKRDAIDMMDVASDDEDTDVEAGPGAQEWSRIEGMALGDAGDDEVVKALAAGDDQDDTFAALSRALPEKVVRCLQQATLLAYHAASAMHMLGPDNRYSVMAVRSLWDRSQAAAPGSQERIRLLSLLGMLRDKFEVDVRSALEQSDRHLLKSPGFHVDPRLTYPTSVGLSAAAAWAAGAGFSPCLAVEPIVPPKQRPVLQGPADYRWRPLPFPEIPARSHSTEHNYTRWYE